MEKSAINLKIDKDLKKKLKLIAIEEEVTLTEILTGFIEYGIQYYEIENQLLKK